MYGAAEIGTVTSINLLKDKKNLKVLVKAIIEILKLKFFQKIMCLNHLEKLVK